MKCIHCLTETEHTHYDYGVNPICGDANSEYLSECEEKIESALEEGEIIECQECEQYEHTEETIQFYEGQDLCYDCYDKVSAKAEVEKMNECSVITLDEHIETYGVGFPNMLRHRHAEAWLYHHNGRLRHEDCFIHPLEDETMTLEAAWNDFIISNDSIEVEEFIKCG